MLMMVLHELLLLVVFFFFSSRRRHTRSLRDWSSDVCSSDLLEGQPRRFRAPAHRRDDLRAGFRRAQPETRSEERRVGKGVDLGGRRIIKKKKTKRKNKTSTYMR